MKTRTQILTAALALLACALLGADKKKGPSSKPAGDGWHKVKSKTDSAKSKPTFVKFQISSPKWRVRLDCEKGSDVPGESIRAAVMMEFSRDIDNLPQGWQQVDLLYDGEPPKTITKQYDDGVDKDGKPRWFQITINGHRAKYSLLVEDQGEGGAKSK
ncbi:MAG: hypothetical protein ACREJC_18165 [Tepidisphaeraceae bacterium]